MPRRKREKENIRNLGQFGKRTYFVTVPVDFIRKLKWKERQKLELSLDLGQKRIIIKDWKKHSAK